MTKLNVFSAIHQWRNVVAPSCFNQLNKNISCKKQRGFSLLEILVALAILALIALALGRQGGQSLNQAQTLSLKTQALWMIEDRLVAMERAPWPEPGRTAVNLPDDNLQIITEVIATSDEDFRRITVSVVEITPQQQEPREILSMTAFKGRY